MTKLEELKAALEAATPGEWASLGFISIAGEVACLLDSRDGERLVSGNFMRPDAKFIALAHNLMPQLLEAVETLRAIRARYEGEFDNKTLMDKGALLTDPCEDMYTFAKDYLEKQK